MVEEEGDKEGWWGEGFASCWVGCWWEHASQSFSLYFVLHKPRALALRLCAKDKTLTKLPRMRMRIQKPYALLIGIRNFNIRMIPNNPIIRRELHIKRMRRLTELNRLPTGVLEQRPEREPCGVRVRRRIRSCSWCSRINMSRSGDWVDKIRNFFCRTVWMRLVFVFLTC